MMKLIGLYGVVTYMIKLLKSYYMSYFYRYVIVIAVSPGPAVGLCLGGCHEIPHRAHRVYRTHCAEIQLKHPDDRAWILTE